MVTSCVSNMYIVLKIFHFSSTYTRTRYNRSFSHKLIKCVLRFTWRLDSYPSHVYSIMCLPPPCVCPLCGPTVVCLHRVYTPPCVHSTICMSLRMFVPSCVCPLCVYHLHDVPSVYVSSVCLFLQVYVACCICPLRVYVPPCISSFMYMSLYVDGLSVCMFLRMFVPSSGYPLCVCVPPCLCPSVCLVLHVSISSVYVSLRVYVPSCVYTTVYVPPCVYPSVCVPPYVCSHRVCISVCSFFHMYISSVFMSLLMYVPSVCKSHRV